MTKSVCRCPAYPWPHHLGGGKCDRSSDSVADTPLQPTRVTIDKVYKTKNGVCLARGDDDYYYIGIGYEVDHTFSSFEDPTTDFCSTADWGIAQKYFEKHTGD